MTESWYSSRRHLGYLICSPIPCFMSRTQIFRREAINARQFTRFGGTRFNPSFALFFPDCGRIDCCSAADPFFHLWHLYQRNTVLNDLALRFRSKLPVILQTGATGCGLGLERGVGKIGYFVGTLKVGCAVVPATCISGITRRLNQRFPSPHDNFQWCNTRNTA